MYIIISFILLSSCLGDYNYKKKEKMDKVIDPLISKIFDGTEVGKTIDSVTRPVLKPIRLLFDLFNEELDERLLDILENKIANKRKSKKIKDLLKYIKSKNIAAMKRLLKNEEEEPVKELINLNEELTLSSGSRVSYANLILCKGCHDNEILKMVIKNLPAKNEGLHTVHLACILGSEQFINLLSEQNIDCFKYVNEEESIRMNSLAYAAVFDRVNVVNQLLDYGVRSHEGYILSIILGNGKVKESFMRKVYGSKVSNSSEENKELKEIVQNLGDRNNVFHILPLAEQIKQIEGVETKQRDLFIGDLIEKLEGIGLTPGEIAELLKRENSQGNMAIECIILSWNEKLYKALSSAIKSKYGKSIFEFMEFDSNVLVRAFSSGIEANSFRIIENILNIFQAHKSDVTPLVMAGLDKALNLSKSEVVFFLCKYHTKIRGELLSLLEELSKEKSSSFITNLWECLKSSMTSDLSYKAADLRDIGDMSLKNTEGDYSRNILHYAVMFGNESLVSSIIKRIESLGKRDRLKLLNRKDGEGKTAFHLCFESNCSNILRRLWDCEAKVEDKGDSIKQVDEKGNTPLHYARSIGILRESEKLLGNQFWEVCSCKNEVGRNVLMQYISDLTELEDNSKEVVSFLLENYDYTSRDKEGKSLEMLMIEKGENFFHDYLKDIFKKKGFDKKQKDIIGNNLLHYVAKYSKEGKSIGLFDNKSYCDLGGEK
ncbi:MAG TPA: hypothetical protein DEP20_01585, partial [Fusobacteria bacterium]|nr:hypothetical protein [Fusobacteriota bacterium]